MTDKDRKDRKELIPAPERLTAAQVLGAAIQLVHAHPDAFAVADISNTDCHGVAIRTQLQFGDREIRLVVTIQQQQGGFITQGLDLLDVDSNEPLYRVDETSTDQDIKEWRATLALIDDLAQAHPQEAAALLQNANEQYRVEASGRVVGTTDFYAQTNITRPQALELIQTGQPMLPTLRAGETTFRNADAKLRNHFKLISSSVPGQPRP